MVDDKYGTVVYVPRGHGIFTFPIDVDDEGEDA